MPLIEMLEHTDVAVLVLSSLNTTTMVALGRVSRAVRAAQRGAIRNSPDLLVSAALNSNVLTKGGLMGWFALQSAEADTLPRTRHKRLAGGFYVLYRQPAFERVLCTYLSKATDWEERLQLRQVKPGQVKPRLQLRRGGPLPAAKARRTEACTEAEPHGDARFSGVCSLAFCVFNRMRVVDLFAGVGGMTCGALEAGAEVVLAVDSDPTPLKILGANSPQTITLVATLGEGRDEVSLPPPAPDLHVHISTPCTELSIARRDPKADTSGGLRMMRWAVTLVLERGDRSWSLENVTTKATRALMTELAAMPEPEHPPRPWHPRA